LQFFLFVLFSVCILCMAFFRWWMNPKNITKRRLREIRRKRVVDVQDGELAKIVGTLRYASAPLTAPLSSRRCAYFEARVEQKHGKNSWRKIAEAKDGGSFFLEDESGRALVRLEDLGAALVEDVKFNSGVLHDPTPQAYAFLDEYGESATGMLGFNKTLRYAEGVLEEGEKVVVCGVGRWEVDPDPCQAGEGYRDKPKRLLMTAPHVGKMLVSDDPSVTS